MFLFQAVRPGEPLQAHQERYTYRQMQTAVREAGDGLRSWILAKNKEFSTYGRPIFVAFGPSPYCYRYRVEESEFPASGDGVGDTTPEKLALHMKTALKYRVPLAESDMEFAKKHGIRADPKKAASEDECRALFFIHCQARLEDGAESNRLYVAKHLFEQNAEFENTELLDVSYPTSLAILKNGPASLFAAILSMPNAPKALMAGHAAYPAAEKELRREYPGLRSILPASCSAPVSLSPHFLRGFVRDGMGFDGIIATDASGMGHVQRFFQAARPLLPEGMQKLSQKALFFTLSVYAGVNWPLYASFGPAEKKEVRGIYGSNAEFRALFDALALESLFLKLCAIDPGNPLVQGLERADLSAQEGALPEVKRQKVLRLMSVFSEGSDEFDAKFHSIASRDSRMPGNAGEYAGLPQPVFLVLSRFSETTDLWNRTGIINAQFRKKVVESLAGKKFPEPGKFATEAAWLSALFADKEFASAYNSIDWNGNGMRSIFKEYCGELADGASSSKMEKMKPLVPMKIGRQD